MELKENKRYNWLDLFQIPRDKQHYAQIHCSGHMEKEGLFKMIRIISPKLLIPVHTKHPEQFSEEFDGEFQVIIPKKYKKYEI